MSKNKLVTSRGEELVAESTVRPPKAVHPFGSSILIEILNPDEQIGTKLYLGKNTKVDDAPQAYIVELGPKVPEDSGLKVGLRIYWQGNCIPLNDPRAKDRVRGLVEIHQIKAVVED